MSRKIIICDNVLDPKTWIEYDCDNILDFLLDHFNEWPTNARLYNKSVCETLDVTPNDEKDVENLNKLEGPFYVVLYPGEFATVGLIVSLIVLAVVIFTPKPKIPLPALRTGESQSPNNALSERSNKARINARIPDIFGQVRSTPDLIGLPYKFFIDNNQYEHSYMCIGRGAFVTEDIREDTTLVSDIRNSSLEIYGAFTSPNSGDEPQLRIGKAIDLEIKNVYRSSSVNNQILGVDSVATIYGSGNIKFTHDYKIVATPTSGLDFTTFFAIGQPVVVTNAIGYVLDRHSPDYGEIIYDYNGTYTITAVSALEITVSDPSFNPDWYILISTSTDSGYISAHLLSSADAFIGSFIITKENNEEVWCNFTAPNGIYKDDGTTKTAIPVAIEVSITPIDSTDTPIGSSETFGGSLLWNYTDDLSLGITLKCIPTFTGRCAVKARRLTAIDPIAGFQIYDEVRWQDLYSVSSVSQLDFGNVTTVQTLFVNIKGSQQISDRKLNMLVTRKLPTRITGSSFSSELYPTKYADDIISFICLDKYIGNRQISEVDFDNIYQTILDIIDYFGTDLAAEFSYTFDSSNLSFEEIISSIATSIFSIAYRRGSKIKLFFEKANDISTILFNHRNKIPGSETRTISFGNTNDNDGIEYQYVNPDDDTIKTIYVPSDHSAINPMRVESIGIRNYAQAYFNAYRLFNKIKYKTIDIDFEATQEAAICIKNDRILVSDGTRSGSMEGEIIDQSVLTLTLSQDVNLLDGVDYTIFLQYSDGTIESKPITKTIYPNKVILGSAPAMDLAYDFDLYAKTTFIITSNTDTRKTAFILTEKHPKSAMTSNLKAINYDARYYQNDGDFATLSVPEDLYTRQNSSFTSSSLADNASENIDLTINKIAYIRRISTNHNARIEIFATAAARTAGTGAIVDQTINGLWIANPIPVFENGDLPQANVAYIKITNLSGSTNTITVSIDYVKYTSFFTPGIDILYETHLPVTSENLPIDSTVTTPSLLPGEKTDVEITLAKATAISAIGANRPCEIRMYNTAAARTADYSRPTRGLITAGNGVVCENAPIVGKLTINQDPAENFFNHDLPLTNKAYLSVTNNDTVSGTITITIKHLPM